MFIMERSGGLEQMAGMVDQVQATGVPYVGVDADTLRALLFLANEGASSRAAPVKIRFGT